VVALARFGIAGYWAQSFWGGALAALGGALLLGAVGRLRSGPRVVPALALGAGLGILALTRPFEGLVASLPAAAFLAWKLRSPGRVGGGAWVVRVVAPMLAVTSIALGFLAVYNRAVTGSALRMPYFAYHLQNSRISPWMWGTPPPAPEHRHAVIRAFFEDEADTRARQTASPGTLAGAIAFKLWSAVDFPFAPALAALLLLCGRALIRARASRFAAVTVLLVLAAIAQETVSLPHYAAPAAAGGFLLVAQALRAVNARRARGRGAVAVAVVLAVVGGRFAVRLLEDADTSDAFGHLRASTEQRLVESHGDDIVFVRYGPRHLPHLEWVWNGAEPASQPVLWVRSRGSAEDRALRELHAGRRAWLLFVDAGDQEPLLTDYAP
ncbi:MAG: hypothetical protein HUU15_13420, partial [Candidatus Brocadiae bacterium]|nr:hypothetical protein [Candidatus Brocadiia bacterium]